jgi:hypothetical protein
MDINRSSKRQQPTNQEGEQLYLSSQVQYEKTIVQYPEVISSQL